MSCYRVEYIENNTYRFFLDGKVLTKNAVLNGAYKYSGKAYFKIDSNNDNLCIQIIFKDTIDYDSVKRFVYDFHNEIIDQQLRLDLDDRTGYIKKLIYEKAFSSLRVNK